MTEPRDAMALLGRAAALAIIVASATLVFAAPPESGEERYPQLLELLHDQSLEEVFERCFELVLSDSQLCDYLALEHRERSLYRRRFWLRNDPTPATDDNELLNEFARRIDYVLANFCFGDSLSWDDRGDITIRFGLPASRMRSIGRVVGNPAAPFIAPGETWSYAGLRMLVEFEDRNLDGRYDLTHTVGGLDAARTEAASRAVVPPLDVPVNNQVEVPDVAAANMAIEGKHLGQETSGMLAKGYGAARNVPMSYGYSPAAPPITVFYEIVTAKGPEGSTDVAVNYQIPLSSLRIGADSNRAEGSVVKRLRILDRDHNVIASEVRLLGVSCEPTVEPAAPGPVGSLITDEWRLEAPPGEYTIEIAVEDTLTGRAGFGRSRTFIRGYRGRRLAMSGIQLSTDVGAGSRFLRMGGPVTPNPCHAYWRDGELVIYFELYNLTEDRPGQSRFTVTTEISTREEEQGWLDALFSPERPHAISSRVVATGSVPETAYWFSIDLENLPEGNYDLTVTVKDVRSKDEATERTAFTVLEKRPRADEGS